ncbi:MAG: hypothetical protein B0D92_07420 [Spirochaeta sp. LUC14_002_19_P3]|nr:MAG: hypothetical protein B0D92_07420 [Spirochaeta sp. LUC14_002_19_P3]
MELNIILHEPEIPQNTGSIGRTCMALGAKLHLIQPLGFSLEDKYLKRAGMDYWRRLNVECYSDWPTFLAAQPELPLWYFTTKARKCYNEAEFSKRLGMVFGRETGGLPDTLLEKVPERCLRIPMLPEARSLNLAVTVGIAACEVLRQHGFAGLTAADPEKRLKFH